MSLRDLDEFFSDFEVPVGGKLYAIPDVDAETGIWLTQVMDAGIAVKQGRKAKMPADLDDAEERNLYQRCLGATFDQLRADGVSWGKIRHIGTTAFVLHVHGRPAAERFWEDGVNPDPEGKARGNRASRRASAASGNATPSRASTNGTKATSRAAASRTPG